MPWLARQAESENTTPERYITSHVLYSMKQKETTGTGQRQLEDILEARDKGPFIEIADIETYRRNLRQKVLERVEQSRHA